MPTDNEQIAQKSHQGGPTPEDVVKQQTGTYRNGQGLDEARQGGTPAPAKSTVNPIRK